MNDIQHRPNALACCGTIAPVAHGNDEMTPELIGILGVGVALATLILATTVPALRELRRDIGDVRRDVGDLRDRMARIEGLFEGFTGRQQPEGGAP